MLPKDTALRQCERSEASLNGKARDPSVATNAPTGGHSLANKDLFKLLRNQKCAVNYGAFLYMIIVFDFSRTHRL
jgi:hypothetical protein